MNPIDDVIKRLNSMVPEGVTHIQKDIEDSVKQVMQAQLKKMDVVTREEFDVQQAVLMKTREKVEVLEQRVAELEKKLEIK